MAWELELNESVLEDLYIWIDNIPLSKPKRKIERDFSDGNYQIDFYLIKYFIL
jgi:hypothetical protein